MRISDWSSDVCSSDLSTRKSTASGPRARREPGAVPRLEADGRRSGATCAGRRHAARCDSGTRAEIGIISPAGPVARHAVLHRPRSEEHTSELQSLMRISYAVFCLKKKKMNNNK